MAKRSEKRGTVRITVRRGKDGMMTYEVVASKGGSYRKVALDEDELLTLVAEIVDQIKFFDDYQGQEAEPDLRDDRECKIGELAEKAAAGSPLFEES